MTLKIQEQFWKREKGFRLDNRGARSKVHMQLPLRCHRKNAPKLACQIKKQRLKNS